MSGPSTAFAANARYAESTPPEYATIGALERTHLPLVQDSFFVFERLLLAVLVHLRSTHSGVKLGSMSFFALKSPLSASDRIERRRLIFADSLALITLFAITALLAISTNYLYQSYASHQVKLADRWLQRGEQAMRDGKPQAAIDALSSALAFDPNQRNTQIKLAQALASAGRIQEATVYFNSLLESQQGSGVINLQLARLAVRQGDETQAIDDYQRAIYGNWEGDSYVRRQEVRFELIKYLIAHQQLDRARSELLVASGNAPGDDISVQLEIARLMELAQDPADALHLYKTLLHLHPSLREALEGAGHTAFQLGRYLEAKHYLSHALEGPAVDKEPPEAIATSRNNPEPSHAFAGALSISWFAPECADGARPYGP